MLEIITVQCQPLATNRAPEGTGNQNDRLTTGAALSYFSTQLLSNKRVMNGL